MAGASAGLRPEKSWVLLAKDQGPAVPVHPGDLGARPCRWNSTRSGTVESVQPGDPTMGQGHQKSP